jgi:polyene macrolide polyketide synthase
MVVVPCSGRDDLGDVPGAAIRQAQRLLDLARTWLADRRWDGSRLVVATSGAVSTAGEPVTDVAAASVWGLVRSAMAENPGRFLLVDTDATAESRSVFRAAVTAAVARGETELAIRSGDVAVPRLAHWNDVTRHAGSPISGTVVVTGGTGVLGAQVARHLVKAHGVRHIVLVSRSGPSAPGAQELQAELAALGAEVTTSACDATDRDALAAVLAAIPSESPLTGVVHAAGVLDDGILESLDAERLERVMAPKVRAAWNLHELTRDLDPPLFALFSSVSGVIGSAGQANYAAANAFLDALAHSRHGRGLAATSVAWGYWNQASGMTGHLTDADLARMRRTGILPLSTAEGLALFDAGWVSGQPALVPVRLDLARLRAGPDTTLCSPLRGLVRTPVRRTATSGSGTSASGTSGSGTSAVADDSTQLARRLRGLPETDQDGLLVDLVCAHVADVLGRTTAAGTETSFKDLGFDSLSGVELRNRLALATGLRLPATLVFDYPTPTALARHLHTALGVSPPPADVPASDVPASDVPASGVPATGEDGIRQALATIPLGRLREAGVLDVLLRLTRAVPAADVSATEPDLATLDTDGLVRLALGADGI